MKNKGKIRQPCHQSDTGYCCSTALFHHSLSLKVRGQTDLSVTFGVFMQFCEFQWLKGQMSSAGAFLTEQSLFRPCSESWFREPLPPAIAGSPPGGRRARRKCDDCFSCSARWCLSTVGRSVEWLSSGPESCEWAPWYLHRSLPEDGGERERH